jgi:hypothetical protein
MNYQHLTLELPALTDEAAASLHKFVEALMYAVDDQYYKQIHRYYANKLEDMLADSQSIQKPLDNPPF